jgi:hypothetical protein
MCMFGYTVSTAMGEAWLRSFLVNRKMVDLMVFPRDSLVSELDRKVR